MAEESLDQFAGYEAPEGTIWVCGACGKTARNSATGGVSSGWDESCMLNAVLCKENKGPDGWVMVESTNG
jgi:hypothetical protein